MVIICYLMYCQIVFEIFLNVEEDLIILDNNYFPVIICMETNSHLINSQIIFEIFLYDLNSYYDNLINYQSYSDLFEISYFHYIKIY